jgi:hypothetical protein
MWSAALLRGPGAAARLLAEAGLGAELPPED